MSDNSKLLHFPGSIFDAGTIFDPAQGNYIYSSDGQHERSSTEILDGPTHEATVYFPELDRTDFLYIAAHSMRQALHMTADYIEKTGLGGDINISIDIFSPSTPTAYLRERK